MNILIQMVVKLSKRRELDIVYVYGADGVLQGAVVIPVTVTVIEVDMIVIVSKPTAKDPAQRERNLSKAVPPMYKRNPFTGELYLTGELPLLSRASLPLGMPRRPQYQPAGHSRGV